MDGGATVVIAGTLRVLVADDHASHRRRLCHLLGRRGYRVRAVVDGQAAVATFARESFDVVLMDLQMPALDGVAAAQLMRALEQAGARRTPILGLAAHALSAERALNVAACMDGHLIKPLKAAELFTAIEHAIGKHARTRAPQPAPECVVDLDALRDEVGDEQTVVNLCRVVMQEATQLTGELESALAADDMDGLGRIARRLKGSLGIVHAPRAVARLAELEAAAHAGDRLRARGEFNASRSMLTALLSRLGEAQRTAAA
jgi:CheY-like chemotaxis protein